MAGDETELLFPLSSIYCSNLLLLLLLVSSNHVTLLVSSNTDHQHYSSSCIVYDTLLTCFLIAGLCRTTLLCYFLASALRVVSGCSNIWGKHLNTTNKQLKPATSRPRAYWRLKVTYTAGVRSYLCPQWDVVYFFSGGTTCNEFLKSQDKIDYVFSLFLFSSSPVEEAILRSIHSSPCISEAGHPLQRPLSALVSSVPHSWSTGSLFDPSTLSFTPPHLHPHSSEDATCHWTVGMG